MPEKEEKPTKIKDFVAKELFQSRTVLLFGEMTPKLSEQVTSAILALAHKSQEPIKLIINSPGGHVESGDTIHDLIRLLPCPVKVVGTGYVASIASHIYLAAKLENRLCFPNTRFLLHQPSGGSQGQASDIAIQAQQIVEMKKRINEIIAERTGQPLDRVQQDTERDYWMTPKEAKDYGMVGRIISSYDEI
ncbi:MAG: ATP-dependent Clp protease proteolytic subunit [Proteobacteria bacterium]|nr:ATP-dependent Clp protease proteolytic subunit [Pseudomonadota bacterium]